MSYAHYFLQVNIYLVIFYAFYKLLLDKETYFVLNRVYLLTASLLSLSIPFLRPEWFARQPATQQIKVGIDQLNMAMSELNLTPDAEVQQFSWWQLAVLIYAIGTLYFFARFLIRLFSIPKHLRTSPSGTAFSFFRTKVIDVKLPEIDTIHQHEELHIRQLHSIDVLFFELLNVFFWCNPVIYFYKDTIKNIHEYLADEAAANYLGDKESYAILLSSKAFGVDQNVLTNSFFNKSLIKKRIFMLHQHRSKKTSILKYGLFLPLFVITLFLSSATISNNNELKAVAKEIAQPITLLSGDWAPFYTHMRRLVRYPAEAQNKQVQGNTIVQFTVNAGAVSGLSVSSSLGAGCDAEVMKSILAFPGFKSIENGKYSLKVAFKMEGTTKPFLNEDAANPKGYTALTEIFITASGPESTDKVYDFTSIDMQPSFQGGMVKFFNYLKTSTNYPTEAKEKQIQGKVFLSFTIETDGTLTDIRVDRSLGYGTDEEAIRLIQGSPKWIPGTKDGKAVRVRYNIPISFSLVEKTAPTDIRIRENDNTNKPKPLYIIDGVKMERDLSSLNPNDIESISVVKDVAAIKAYGKEGENGVILITTKNGKKTGMPTKAVKKKNK